MFYIHQTVCISPQETFLDIKLADLHESVENKLNVLEPSYEGISPTLLRRMGKSVRIGVGAALPLLKTEKAPDGIIIGTGNSGMEESVKFLKQIIEYGEDTLAPGNFVQSTANTIASQISLLTRNKGYNITHVHRGLAFENALIDAAMQVKEHAFNTYLLGGVDEISTYNYNLDRLQGLYKKATISNKYLYESNSAGTLAGEGATMFLVNGNSANALAKVIAIANLHSEDGGDVKNKLQQFLDENLPAGEEIDLLISGENGDNRLIHYYSDCESMAGKETTVVRFKHMTGEYPSSSAFALWLACHLPGSGSLPEHMIKKHSTKEEFKHVLIYNNHKGSQHSCMLVSRQAK